MSPRRDGIFLLGGNDLEMETIRDLLAVEAPGRVRDRALTWEQAVLSAYWEALVEIHRAGDLAVAVELRPDIDPASVAAEEPGMGPLRLRLIDHHGPQAGADRPSALRQVFDLLGLPPQRWTRWYALVEANDIGHIRGLRAAGADEAEIVEIRAADRRAQGVSEEDEAAAMRAIGEAESVNGALMIRLPVERTSPVVDRLMLGSAARGEPDPDIVVVVTPTKVTVDAPGKVIAALADRLPGGWWGGALPERGFWGRVAPVGDVDAEMARVLDVVRQFSGR